MSFGVSVLFFAFLPIAGLILKLDLNSLTENWSWEVLLNVCTFTIKQAFVSALLSVIIGIIAAPGLNSKFAKLLRPLFILPNLMSSLLVVLALLNAIPNFPYGFWGIVLGHVYINSGLAALWLGQSYNQIRNQVLPIAQVYDIKGITYFTKIIIPQLRPSILSTFAVIFSFCMAGFTIPLILGGGPGGATIEVLIYESIKAHSDVSSAVVFAIIQVGLQLFSAFLILYFSKKAPTITLIPKQISSSTKASTVLTFLICITLTLPFLFLVTGGFSNWAKTKEMLGSAEYLFAFKNSISIGLAVALICFIASSWLLAKGWPNFLTRVPGISSIVIGLGLLLMLTTPPIEFNLQVLLFLIWGHWAILFLPLFRLLAPELQNSRNHFEKVGAQLGLTSIVMFQKVYFPACKNVLFSIAALAFCWSIGEFAITALVAPTQSTLTLYTQGLLASYRTDAAVSSSFALVFVSLLAVIIFDQMAEYRSRQG